MSFFQCKVFMIISSNCSYSSFQCHKWCRNCKLQLYVHILIVKTIKCQACALSTLQSFVCSTSVDLVNRKLTQFLVRLNVSVSAFKHLEHHCILHWQNHSKCFINLLKMYVDGVASAMLSYKNGTVITQFFNKHLMQFAYWHV